MSKKSIIKTYECSVYEVILVVANQYSTLEELKELYEYSDGAELDEEILAGAATTSTCYRKSDKACVSLVKYNSAPKCTSRNKEAAFINVCSHEATHVALDIYQSIKQNVCFYSPEPFCYLIGWATECIYKTLKQK